MAEEDFMAGGSASRLSERRNEVSGFGSYAGNYQDRNLATGWRQWKVVPPKSLKIYRT
jgi:hypothetical protein